MIWFLYSQVVSTALSNAMQCVLYFQIFGRLIFDCLTEKQKKLTFQLTFYFYLLYGYYLPQANVHLVVLLIIFSPTNKRDECKLYCYSFSLWPYIERSGCKKLEHSLLRKHFIRLHASIASSDYFHITELRSERT